MHAKFMHKAILGGTKIDIHNKSGGTTPTLAAHVMEKQSRKGSLAKKERGSLETLASIVTMELGSSAKKSKAAHNTTKKKSMKELATKQRQSQTLVHKKSPKALSLQETRASFSGATTQSSVMSYHQGPLSSHRSGLYAARMAQEKELALYLQQRQQLTNLDLERLQQLEHLRRVQAAMFLYGPAPGLQPTALDMETILASHRVRTGSMTPEEECKRMLHPVHQPKQPGTSLASEIGKVDHSKSHFSATAAGATPSLMNFSMKRSADVMRESGKYIKERPEEYQHLSKKAKNTPLQRAVASKFGLDQSQDQAKKLAEPPNDLDNSVGSDDGDNGHRFRPYQYEQWTEKFQELCDFRQEKGHCQVPHTYSENPPLARWVKRQRYQYKLKAEGKMSTMTDERVKLLENIGFIWDSHAAAWAEKLHELKDYLKVHGDCNVPSSYPANPQLATWVKCQRRQYKLLRDEKMSNMTVDRIMELDKLGFVWEVRKTWDQSGLSGISPLPCITAKAK